MADVKKIPSVSFMTTGKAQDAAIFSVTVDEIKQYVAQTATAAFGQQVKPSWVEIIVAMDDEANVYNPETRSNESTYKTSCQIILPKPFNLYSTDAIEAPMLGRTIGDYSPQVIDFVRKFAKLKDKNGKRLKDGIKDFRDRYVIMTTLPAIFDQMFDASGFYYQKTFNQSDRPVEIRFHPVINSKFYDERNGKITLGSRRSGEDNSWVDGKDFFEYFEVVKKYANTTKSKRGLPITKAKLINIYS